jgi:hypothetical protein
VLLDGARAGRSRRPGEGRTSTRAALTGAAGPEGNVDRSGGGVNGRRGGAAASGHVA